MTASFPLVAATASSALALLVMHSLVRPRRRLGPRVDPYVALARARLGTGPSPSALVASPAPAALVAWWRRSAPEFGLPDDDLLERRLRQAGWVAVDVAQYRIRHVAATVGGATVGGLLGVVLFDGAAASFLLFVSFSVVGLTWQRGRLGRSIAQRRRLMRAEVSTVAQLIAVHLRTGHGPVEAVRGVAIRLHGPIAGELSDALDQISGGTPPQQAYERLAESTPEPMAARLHRLLATSVRSGADIVGPLLAIADEVRAERRDAVLRASVKRRSAMVVPLLVLVAPVMVLFVAAALPSLVFGVR